MSRYRIAVDTGGTFTDVYAMDEQTGDVRVRKVPSTPADPMEAVVAGVRSAEVDLQDVALFSHGSTVATNALITRQLPPAAMVTTRGFRDVIEIGRGTKEDLWDAYKDSASPYIRRRHRLEVCERVDYQGRILQPLDEQEARDAARVLRRRDITAVAICFINAYANPVHEERMREILQEELPGVDISTSSGVIPEIFEHERFSTTVANAVLSPLVGGYVNRLEQRLREDGYGGDLLLLHSGGGTMTPSLVRDYAVRLAGSGIAAGAIATRELAQLCGYRNAIGLDMGGTSADISLVSDGELRTTKEWHIEYGNPIYFPSIEVLTIGAGGGSLGWLDEAGSLRNGPQSAGAVPGPACYGRGGIEPTNTDANLLLGRLGTELVGGEMTLEADKARTAMHTRVADPLGMGVDDAAAATLEVADANMADAIRLVSIRRGYDPREFVLVASGGAGPLHAAALAQDLDIPTVLVPPNPGIASALGCLQVDVRHDLADMYLCPTNQAEPPGIESRFRKLEDHARERLSAEGVPAERMSLQRSISMRYLGQWRSMSVVVGPDLTTLDNVVARFHEEHQREHNYRQDDAPVEIYQLALRAVGITPKPTFQRLTEKESHAPPPTMYRQVRHTGGATPLDTPIYQRSDLPAGMRLHGPAIVEQLDSTTVLPPGATAEVDEWGVIRINLTEVST